LSGGISSKDVGELPGNCCVREGAAWWGKSKQLI
jgi:hypothetical protein